MNILIKNLHVLFMLYAGYLAFDYQTVQEEKLVSVTEQLSSIEDRLAKTNKELLAVRKFQENLEDSKKRVKEVVAKIEEMQRQLPSDIQDTVVTGKVTEFATELRMVAPSSVPKLEVNNKFYFSKEYAFEAQGTFLQTLIFFEKLEQLSKTDRILNVKKVSMKVAENADPRSRFKILDFTTIVEAYRYNTAYDPTKDI